MTTQFQLSLSERLKPLHRERIAIIEAEDFTPLARKVAEETGNHDPDFLEEGATQLKAYYALCVIDPLNAHGVSAKLDPFWHAHLLHTRDHMDFCDRVFGGYLHHEPLDRTDAAALEDATQTYEYTRQTLQDAYGDLSKTWWVGSKTDINTVICVHYKVADPALNANALFAAH